MSDSFYRELLVDISDNLSNGASASYAIGKHEECFTPSVILAPASLQSITHVKIQVAYASPRGEAVVDGDFKDIYVDGAIVYIPLVASGACLIPQSVAGAVPGATHMRLVTTVVAGTATDPAADITFTVVFTEAEELISNNAVGVAAGGLASGVSYTNAFGEVAGAATATVFPSLACKYVKIKAEYNNVGRVYIGLSGATKQDGTSDTTTGWELSAGEETSWIPVTNMSTLFRICDNAGDDVTYHALI